jgi:hypothetical protein
MIVNTGLDKPILVLPVNIAESPSKTDTIGGLISPDPGVISLDISSHV